MANGNIQCNDVENIDGKDITMDIKNFYNHFQTSFHTAYTYLDVTDPEPLKKETICGETCTPSGVCNDTFGDNIDQQELELVKIIPVSVQNLLYDQFDQGVRAQKTEVVTRRAYVTELITATNHPERSFAVDSLTWVLHDDRVEEFDVPSTSMQNSTRVRV